MNLGKAKIVFLLGNLIPFVQLLIFAYCLSKMSGILQITTFIFLFIYLLPPFLFKVLNWIFPTAPGGYKLTEKGFIVWWYGAQLQLIFARFSFLEEFLRLIPFAYSFWLRLWGAKIGTHVYWSPKVEIIDRNLIDIGDSVVMGYGVKMTSHLINKNKIFLAPI